jgi:peptidylprolyl isomerase
MKYVVLTSVTLMFILLSCDKFGDSNVLTGLEKAEYTRKFDPQQMSRWLNDDDPAIRQRAVQTLGRIQDSTQAVQLANRLTDADFNVRYAAIFALGQLFSPQAEPYLANALLSEADKENRLAIIEALGKSGANRNPNLLKDFVESSDPEYQKESAIACGVLAYRGYHPHTLANSLGRLMNNKRDPDVAWRGAYAVYRIGALRSFNDLAEALTQNDPLTRYYALKGLDQMVFLMNAPQFNEVRSQAAARELLRLYNSPDFRQSIVNQSQDSSYWYIRQAAVELMGNMNDQSMQNQIVKLLDDSHPYVQIQAIRSSGNYKNWLTRREMRRVYSEVEDWRIKGEALVILSLVQPNEALDFVKKDLLNKPWPQNYYAIRTLDSLKSADPRRKLPEEEAATKLLMELANSEQNAQVSLALEVLVDRRQPPEIDFFIEKLDAADPAIATIVASYLAVVNDPRPSQAVKPLIEIYQKFQAPRDQEAMEAIITALDSIGSQEAIPFLREQLANPFPTIQQKAQRALIKITGQNDIQIPPVQQGEAVKWDFKKVNPDSSYRVLFHTTAGVFTIELYPQKAPLTVANFISLIRQNFYNGVFFHRVVPGFVIQTGDLRGDGWGGAGYAIPCEYNDLDYERGVVGMALSGKDTGSSQFFITHTPQPHLNGKYTAFGRVVSGMDVVEKTMIFDRVIKTELSIH